ncbi:MAG: hypothetical protein DRZ76_03620 [Candidatus Nealsonbacteria bacterium]|nr:MAG: hypothetical protein DRZ76_03620 [Candidatus Nealsonbacteria bacterium]
MWLTLKIAVISRGWWPSIKGGSEKFAVKVSTGLYVRGHEVIGITRWIHGFPRPDAPHKLIIMKERKIWPLLSSFRFSLWASEVANKLDVDMVLVNSYWGEISPLYIRKPCIAIVHDVGFLEPVTNAYIGFWRLKTKILSRLVRKHVLAKVLEQVDAIIVPTKLVRNKILTFFNVDSSKVYVLGFEGVEGPFEKIHIKNRWFDIVCIGRFAPNKGQLILLEAFHKLSKKLPNIRLWLIGSHGIGYELYLSKVMSIAKQINAELGDKRVYVIVNAPEIDWYYKIADICVFPSLGEEGYGLAILEAMAYGKPVVCSDIFAETGIATLDRALIVPRGDVKALANAIIKLYYDPKLREVLSRKGLEYAKTCRWDKVVERIEGILLNIIG